MPVVAKGQKTDEVSSTMNNRGPTLYGGAAPGASVKRLVDVTGDGTHSSHRVDNRIPPTSPLTGYFRRYLAFVHIAVRHRTSERQSGMIGYGSAECHETQKPGMMSGGVSVSGGE